MIRLVLLLVALAAALWAYHDWRKTDAAKKRQKGIQYSLYSLAGVVLLLVVTGRANWIFAPVAIALPYIRRFALNQTVINWVLGQFSSRASQNSSSSQKRTASDIMNTAEAREILGFSPTEPITKDQIKQRHRSLIQKVHPDRSDGSHFLATKINNARDVLLSTLEDS